jgi:Protein of unknown function (DUF3108)
MRRTVLTLLLTLVITPAAAQQVSQVHLTYDTYAAGIRVMEMHAFFGFGPWNYHIDLDYHTTGLIGLLNHGQQTTTVYGLWDDDHAAPLEFFGAGVWRGQQRRTLIDYNHGVPVLKDLEPRETEREPVPPQLQLHTTDTLSALAQLVRKVELAHTCETSVHIYDGRRVLNVVAHTGGAEQLGRSNRSIHSGPTLRCDFEANELAGFLLGANDEARRRPLHGSVWLAPMLPGAPPLPVRIALQTLWFGWATMYLTAASEQPLEDIAHN